VNDERYDDENPLAAADGVGPMDPCDPYERDIDDVTDGLSVCAGDDCRAPREGPFVIDLHDDEPVVLCYACFASERLRIDPDDLGLI